MVFDYPNLEEVVKEDGIEVYEKVWGASASKISNAMTQTFRVGSFLESLILRQDRAVELLQNLCADVATDRTWDDKGLRTTNLRVVELEAQGLENFPEWREKLRVALEQVGWVEAEVKGLQVAFGDANVTQNRHEDELKLIFDKLSMFQEGFLHNIHTMTERVKKMESSTLAVFTAQGLSQMEALVYQILDMEGTTRASVQQIFVW